MNILEKHQVVCTIKLWYQKRQFKGMGCIGGIASEIGIYIHKCQYICQYAIIFKDYSIKTFLMVYVYVGNIGTMS